MLKAMCGEKSMDALECGMYHTIVSPQLGHKGRKTQRSSGRIPPLLFKTDDFQQSFQLPRSLSFLDYKLSEGFFPSGNNSSNHHQTHVQWRAGQTKDLVERRKSSRGTGTGEGWEQSLCKSRQSRRKDIVPSIIGRVPVKAPRVAATS